MMSSKLQSPNSKKNAFNVNSKDLRKSTEVPARNSRNPATSRPNLQSRDKANNERAHSQMKLNDKNQPSNHHAHKHDGPKRSGSTMGNSKTFSRADNNHRNRQDIDYDGAPALSVGNSPTGKMAHAHSARNFHDMGTTGQFSSIDTASIISGEKCSGPVCICGKHRQPDTYIHYRYPKQIGSLYTRDFIKHPMNSSQEIFNPEKEHKIINPHKMELNTTHKVDFKPFVVIPQKPSPERPNSAKVPFLGLTSYQANYVNWGSGGVNIEKHPQYPVHTLPFDGKTTYSETFRKPDVKKTEEHYTAAGSTLNSFYKAAPFNAQTTKMMDYKPFKIVTKVESQKPKHEIIRTYTFPEHFQTTHSREFKPLQGGKCPCDNVPLMNSTGYAVFNPASGKLQY